VDGELLKAIGAAIGIAVSAIASSIAAVIAFLRYRADQRHIVVRLKAWKPSPEDPRNVSLKASVFNQGRVVFIEDVFLHLGGEYTNVRSDIDFPTEIATGRSIHVSFGLATFEADLESIRLQFDEPNEYSDSDIPKMRLRVADGEGHEHWARLTGESVRNIEAVLKARIDHPYPEVRLKPPSKRET